MENPTIIKTKILTIGSYQKEGYAQILYRGQEVGFINKDGIYLKMYSQHIPQGCFQKITASKDASFNELCKFLEQNWKAIYDRYITIFRGL